MDLLFEDDLHNSAKMEERGPSSQLLSILPGQQYSLQDNILSVRFAEDPVTITLQLLIDTLPGCGGQLWPSAQVLGSYLIRRHSSLAGKTVVELGSGTGLVGLVAAFLGGQTVITDQLPLLDLMRKNVSINGLADRCTVAELNWGTSIPEDIPRRPDLILAADCVYFEPAFPLLVQTLDSLSVMGTEILFCYKKRRKADKRFFNLLRKKFTCEQVLDDPNREIYAKEAIYLLRLVKLS